MNFEEPLTFINRDMRMSHVYQPVMIRTLLDHAGRATREQIARSLLNGKRPPETLLPIAGSRRDFDLLGHCACEIPGKEFVDLIDGVIGDTCEHFPQVCFWIQPIELGRADQL